MDVLRRDFHRLRFLGALVLLTVASRGVALPSAHDQPGVIQLAQVSEATPRELQPRYEPVPPAPKSWYNDAYLFGMTRGVANSTLEPGWKAPLFLLTVPLDLVLLPFTAIAGCF